MTAFPFVAGSYAGRSAAFDCQRSINLYPEASESKTSRSPAMLIGTPGLTLWAAFGSGTVRGMLAFNASSLFAVIGAGVWRFTTTGTATLIGSITAGSTPVSMASNGTAIMLVTGPQGWFIMPATNTLTQITDSDFAGADTVDFCDGYFVFNKRDTGQFQITQLYGTDIDGLDFATAEGAPDNLVGTIVDHREVWLFGEVTTEVWYNSGDVDFPFARIQGAYLEVGCAAVGSIAKMDNTVFWLGRNEDGIGQIYRAAGYSPQRISTHGVEYQISKLSRYDDAIAYTYQQEGHSFYVLTFPTGDLTLVYDASTNEWHDRAWRDPNTALLRRHRSNCHVFFTGKNLVGDWEAGRIYALDLDAFTDNGDPLPAIRICPHITSDGKLQFHHALEIFMESGVGLTTGQGSNPQAMLQWSEDGGVSWSSDHWASFGAIGQRTKRARWRRLGRSRDRVYRVTITDPVKRIITGASLNVSAGMS